MFCLPQEIVNKFKDKLKSGEINPEKLSEMTSAERRSFLADIVGEANAKSVNALFESKLLLKNQQAGIITWAKKVSGMKPEVLKDIVSKVNRMTEVLQPKELDVFLNDLANQRLGFDVTFEEAGKIVELSKSITEKKELIPEDSPIGSKERMNYGVALTLFKDYVGKLKMKETPRKDYITNPYEAVKTLGGLTKSLKSTLDNSFFGRQGIKTLYVSPVNWGRSFMESWKNIGRELKGQDAMLVVKADAFSRPNALNGNYGRMKLDIGIGSEEAFPSTIPERVPLLGRVFKGAESAFNGAAIRMRVDMADRLIKLAEDQGINVKDSVWSHDAGQQINSLTGRGSINKYITPEGQVLANNVLFSIKFLKSQFDVLLKPFDRNLDPFVRKQAATNLVKIIGGVAAINIIANAFQGDSEFDPRGTNFMKPRVPGTSATIDISGGLASLVTLAARTIIPTKHNGKWGLWSKDQNGVFLDLTGGKFGQQNGWDTLIDGLFSNKLSPMLGLVRDVLRGQNFSGDKVTITSAITGLITPLPIEIGAQIKKSREAGNWMWLMLLEELGLNTSVPKPPKVKASSFK